MSFQVFIVHELKILQCLWCLTNLIPKTQIRHYILRHWTVQNFKYNLFLKWSYLSFFRFSSMLVKFPCSSFTLELASSWANTVAFSCHFKRVSSFNTNDSASFLTACKIEQLKCHIKWDQWSTNRDAWGIHTSKLSLSFSASFTICTTLDLFSLRLSNLKRHYQKKK